MPSSLKNEFPPIVNQLGYLLAQVSDTLITLIIIHRFKDFLTDILFFKGLKCASVKVKATAHKRRALPSSRAWLECGEKNDPEFTIIASSCGVLMPKLWDYKHAGGSYLAESKQTPYFLEANSHLLHVCPAPAQENN